MGFEIVSGFHLPIRGDLVLEVLNAGLIGADKNFAPTPRDKRRQKDYHQGNGDKENPKAWVASCPPIMLFV